MLRRSFVRLALAIGLLGVGLVGSATALADATFSCVNPSNTYTAGGGSNPTVDSGSCTMSGVIPQGTTVTLTGGIGVTAEPGAGNAGTIVFPANAVNTALETAAGGTFQNSGTIDDEATSNAQDLYAGTFTNTGTIETTGLGTQLLFGGSSDPGVLVNASGGILEADDGTTLSINTPTSLLLDAGSSTIADSGSVLKLYASSMELAGGNVTGEMTDFQSNLTFDPSASTSTGIINGTSSFSLAGTIPKGWTVSEAGGGITAAAGAGNAGTFLFEGGNPGLTAAGTFVNSGTMNLTTGTAAVSAGTLQNTGTIGLLAGTALYVSGNLALSSTSALNLGVAGTALSQFGFVRVTGSAALAGTLNVGLGYTPAIGDTQQIFGAGSISGTFAQTSGGNASGFYTVQYTPTTATLATLATTTGSGTTTTTTPTSTRRPTAGKISSTNEELSLRLSCAKGTGACAKTTVTATVTETLKGKKLIAVTASKKSKTTKRVIIIARVFAARAAGASKTLTITLNAAGRALLKRYGTLTTRVVVTSGGKVLRTEDVKLHGTKAQTKKAHSLRA